MHLRIFFDNFSFQHSHFLGLLLFFLFITCFEKAELTIFYEYWRFLTYLYTIAMAYCSQLWLVWTTVAPSLVNKQNILASFSITLSYISSYQQGIIQMMKTWCMLEKRYSVKALIGPIDVRDIDLSFGQARLGPNTTARLAAVILFISHLSTTWNKGMEMLATNGNDKEHLMFSLVQT